MNNLTISYDLYKQGQNYQAIIDAIKALGSWARVHKSVWYVKSSFSASQVVEKLRRVTDANDSIYVVDSTNNQAAWFNLDQKVSDFLMENWNTQPGLRMAFR